MIDFPEQNRKSGASSTDPSLDNPREPADLGSRSLRVYGSPSDRSRYFRFKPMVDWLIAAGFLVPALPLLGATSLMILLLEGRPVFYRQERVGKLGRKFRIWKFRTMCRDAESLTGPVWSTTNDQRVTPLGKWLRSSHLDELPQLLNILAGDMNLIGPRPERPQFVEQLCQDIPGYEERLLVRPGITGLAQIKQGYDTDIADVRRKVELDIEYIRDASLASDIVILFSTLPHVILEMINSRRAARQVEREGTRPAHAPMGLAGQRPKFASVVSETSLADEAATELASELSQSRSA